MKGYPKAIFDFCVFSSLYIAVCAIVMAMQTGQLFHFTVDRNYLFLMNFSTICSYNLHWYLTPESNPDSVRMKWTAQHRKLHLVLVGIGVAGVIFFLIPLLKYFFWIALSGVLTFLYTAPKIQSPPFTYLKKIAIAKTIYLSFVWMYVTTILPFIISGTKWSTAFTLFAISRFFFIYAICIIFDYRDREEDKRHGIRSLITALDEKGINRLFHLSLVICAASSLLLRYYAINWPIIMLLLLPCIITWSLFSYSKKKNSDYLYYFVLDGMMMMPALLTLMFPGPN